MNNDTYAAVFTFTDLILIASAFAVGGYLVGRVSAAVAADKYARKHRKHRHNQNNRNNKKES